MLVSLKLALATTVALFFGCTDYGNQLVNTMTNTNIEKEVELLNGMASHYAKMIAPPSKTHGYTIYSGFLIFALTYMAIVISREVLNRIVCKLYQNREDCEKRTKWVTWNIVSLFFTSMVSIYGMFMVRNVLYVFWQELWESLKVCEFSGFFLNCPVRIINTYNSHNMTPLTNQMINSMDYVNHSSQIMFMTLILFAYFIYDITFNKPSVEYIFHHLLAILCGSVYAYTQTYAFYVLVAMVTELSTVLLSISSMMEGYSISKTLIMIEFAITFFFCRIVLVNIVFLISWFNESGIKFLMITTSFGILSVLNFFWFCVIVRKVIGICKKMLSQENLDFNLKK